MYFLPGWVMVYLFREGCLFALHIKLHVHLWGRVVANLFTGPFFSFLPWVPHLRYVVLPITPTICWC